MDPVLAFNLGMFVQLVCFFLYMLAWEGGKRSARKEWESKMKNKQ